MPPRYEPVEVWEGRPGAATAPLGGYRRRESEKSLLHQVIWARLAPFLAPVRNRSATGLGLPSHVERDPRAYLDCGILGRGFARIRFPGCGFERLVAFSRKAHGCPSCNARRMEDAAERLAQDVFPQVPVRQWVLSFPRRLRFLAAGDPASASRLLDLSGPGRARFVPLPPPGDAELESILTSIIRKLARLVAADEAVERALDVDTFAELQAAEVDRRMRFPDPFKHGRHSVLLDGFSSTPGSGSTRTTARGWSGSSGTRCGRRSRFTGNLRGRRGTCSTR
jgi:hypothetical protein